MGVVVKNFDIPTCCAGCYHVGLAQVIQCKTGDSTSFANRPEGCPLQEMPDEHGTLISRERLIDDLNDEAWDNPWFRNTAKGVAIDVIQRQKIVLKKE